MTKFYWRIGESTNRLIGDSVMRWGDAMKRHRDWAEIHFCVWRALRKCVKKRSGHRIFSEEKQKCREERRLWMHRRNKIAARWWIESMLGTWIFLLRLGINNASIASALAAQETRQAQWPHCFCDLTIPQFNDSTKKYYLCTFKNKTTWK